MGGEAFRVAAPTVVWTLLREHPMTDGVVRVEPRYREPRAGDVTRLDEVLEAGDRRLPVVVLTGTPGGEHLVGCYRLFLRVR